MSEQTPAADRQDDDGSEPTAQGGAVPGQAPGTAVPPVPAPGEPGRNVPEVQAAQGPAPEHGVHAGDKDEGSDASVSSPGAWTAAAPPGKPDGEVDTRG